MPAPPSVEEIFLGDPAFKADPYPVYARLRATCPVVRARLPRGESVWLVVRYDDVANLLKDPRFAKDPANALNSKQLAALPKVPSFLKPLTQNMLGRDDPDHGRLRRLVQGTFTSARVEMLRARTEAIGKELISRVRSRREFDLIRDFAMPLPVAVISNLLGVPVEDRQRFARWSYALVNNAMTPIRMLVGLPQMYALTRYLRRLVDLKRRRPTDDLVSDLVAAEDAGDRLNGDELLAMIGILLTAGHETTTNLIGNGMVALIKNPSQMERLREEPQHLSTAVEELLRYAGPVELSTHRYARETLDVSGVTIERGATVFGSIASANHDELRFVKSAELDITRHPNRHLTFGQGGHYCLGAPLARLEGGIAIDTLLRETPPLRLTKPILTAQWRPGFVLRGLKSLPVTYRQGR